MSLQLILSVRLQRCFVNYMSHSATRNLTQFNGCKKLSVFTLPVWPVHQEPSCPFARLVQPRRISLPSLEEKQNQSAHSLRRPSPDRDPFLLSSELTFADASIAGHASRSPAEIESCLIASHWKLLYDSLSPIMGVP
jgi:hypothetical protein